MKLDKLTIWIFCANVIILVANLVILSHNSHQSRVYSIQHDSSAPTTKNKEFTHEEYAKQIELLDSKVEKALRLMAEQGTEEKQKQNAPLSEKEFNKLPATEQVLVIQREFANPNSPNAHNKKYRDFLESRKAALNIK